MRRRNQENPESDRVRPEQVRRLKKAMKTENDAILLDESPSGAREYQRARAVVEAVWRNCTEAEREAAVPGYRKYKNGYR